MCGNQWHVSVSHYVQMVMGSKVNEAGLTWIYIYEINRFKSYTSISENDALKLFVAQI